MSGPRTLDWPTASRFPASVKIGLIALAFAIVFMRHQRHFEQLEAMQSLLPGFTVDELSPPANGLVVTSLRTSSEAERQGIAVGDHVLAIDRHPLASIDDAEALLHRDLARTIDVELLHQGKPRDIVLQRSESVPHGP